MKILIILISLFASSLIYFGENHSQSHSSGVQASLTQQYQQKPEAQLISMDSMRVLMKKAVANPKLNLAQVKINVEDFKKTLDKFKDKEIIMCIVKDKSLETTWLIAGDPSFTVCGPNGICCPPCPPKPRIVMPQGLFDLTKL